MIVSKQYLLVLDIFGKSQWYLLLQTSILLYMHLGYVMTIWWIAILPSLEQKENEVIKSHQVVNVTLTLLSQSNFLKNSMWRQTTYFEQQKLWMIDIFNNICNFSSKTNIIMYIFSIQRYVNYLESKCYGTALPLRSYDASDFH